MEIGSIAGSASGSVSANVSLQKKAGKQAEVVMNTLLESVAKTPPPGKGQLVNAVA